jgi:hypothetical protein
MDYNNPYPVCNEYANAKKWGWLDKLLHVLGVLDHLLGLLEHLLRWL